MNKLSQIDFSGPDVFKTPFGKGKGFADIASIALWNAIMVAGILMVLLILFGGISIIMSAGNSNSEGAAKGKQAATTGVIGFLIVFSAYWIIQIIELLTGLNILTPGL